jgi:hypothetical protein
MIKIGIALLVLVAGFLCVVYSLWGGLMLILSGGAEEKVKPAVNYIRYSILGLVCILLVLFIAPILGDTLGLPIEYISPSVIYEKM